MATEPEILTLAQAAEYLQVSERTILRALSPRFSTLTEQDRDALRALAENLDALDLHDRARVVRSDAATAAVPPSTVPPCDKCTVWTRKEYADGSSR